MEIICYKGAFCFIVDNIFIKKMGKCLRINKVLCFVVQWLVVSSAASQCVPGQSQSVWSCTFTNMGVNVTCVVVCVQRPHTVTPGLLEG